MLSGDENKPGGKKGKGGRKTEQRSKRAEPPNRKADRVQTPKPDRLQQSEEQIERERIQAQAQDEIERRIQEQIEEQVEQHSDEQPAANLTLTDASPIEAFSMETLTVDASRIEPTAIDTHGIGPLVTAETGPVSLMTIANAYGDYTRKSFEETISLFGKLAAPCPLDKAVEIQTEFAMKAYNTFIAESRNINELRIQLAKQMFERWGGFFVRQAQGAR
jgi:hypothetical protein